LRLIRRPRNFETDRDARTKDAASFIHMAMSTKSSHAVRQSARAADAWFPEANGARPFCAMSECGLYAPVLVQQ
jgi:hypothetical protein